MELQFQVRDSCCQSPPPSGPFEMQPTQTAGAGGENGNNNGTASCEHLIEQAAMDLDLKMALGASRFA